MAPRTRSNKKNTTQDIVHIKPIQNINNNNSYSTINNEDDYLYHGPIISDMQIEIAPIHINQHDTPYEAAKKTRINTQRVYIIGCNYLISLLLDMFLKIFEYIVKGAKGINIILTLCEHLLSSIRAQAALVFNNKTFRELILPVIPFIIIIWFIGFKPTTSYKQVENFTYSIGKYASSGLYGLIKAIKNK